MGRPYQGIIHFHSGHSFDSFLRIRDILKLSQTHGFNFLILTDHGTIGGSRELKIKAAEKSSAIEVPIAAEYHTEFGDIIAAFISEEIKSMQFSEFVTEVKRQHGLLLLPHPYKGHQQLDRIVPHVDMIEIFNPRLTDDQNRKALQLARQSNKKGYFGSDAHLQSELGSNCVQFDNVGTLRDSLLQSAIQGMRLKKTASRDITKSQMIKSLKTLHLLNFLGQLKSLLGKND